MRPVTVVGISAGTALALDLAFLMIGQRRMARQLEAQTTEIARLIDTVKDEIIG